MFIFVPKQDGDFFMNTMFDTLLQLPLFQGLSHEDITQILEKVKVQFTQHKPGEVLLSPGDVCDSLVFLLKGEVCVTTSSTDMPYSLVEYFSAPYLIEFHSLFGMNTSYVSRYVARTDTHLLRISKCYVLDVLLHYEIFRLNCMNILCNRVQTLLQLPWKLKELDIEKRISGFFVSLVERPVGMKIFRIKMKDLAAVLNETRSSISRVLNNMEADHLLELKRGEIVVPAIERLL